jgi:hypothetical protein
VTPNIVLITNFISDNTVPSLGTIFTCAKTYVTLQNVQIIGRGGSTFIGARNITLQNCVFSTYANAGNSPRGTVRFTTATNTPLDTTINKCIFYGEVGLYIEGQTTGATYNINTSITDCLFMANTCVFFDGPAFNTITVGNGLSIYNSVMIHQDLGVNVRSSNFTNVSTIKNCVLFGLYGGISLASNAVGILVEDYNRIASVSTRAGVDVGTNTRVGLPGLDLGATMLTAAISTAMFSPYLTSPLIGGGTSTGAPVSDIYGFSWTSGTDIGAFARQVIGVSSYIPTERNASTITIAPASTSQSIELYLGATGLTFSTSGLAAYYVRNQSAPVAITLVTQTPTGAWASGGFAEISSSLVPGVYRLDVPNAAFAAGASDVTIVVRGASGTNGAVLTVTLSSGGLTAAQTSAAVWDEARVSHTTAGTFGQYVNAELVTPVTSAALVRMGPFEVRADGLGASDPLDIQKGAQHGIDIQCVDNNGAGIDITSATVTAKVYNSGATLVDTYSCTATYAADGRATFTIDTTVTNTPGTYTATITRTTGASDTQVFGPLRIYVRDI